MKKLLIGCGILFMLAIVCSVGCTAVFFYKVNQWAQGFQQGQLALMNVNKEYEFEVPDPGTPMEEDRFQEYLTIRNKIHDRILDVQVLGELIKAADQQNANPQSPPPQPNVGVLQVFYMLGEIPKVMQDFALYFEQSEMSVDEFSWHTVSVVEAISAGYDQGDPELMALWDEVMVDIDQAQTAIETQQSNPQFQGIDLETAVTEAEDGQVPQENIEMVKENLEEFSEGSFLLVVELLILEIMQQAQIQSQYQSGPSGAPISMPQVSR